MLLQSQILVLLISALKLVDSNPHGAHPCPKPPGPGASQDTIFQNCDYGVGGEPRVSIDIISRIGQVNSNTDPNSSDEGSISDFEEVNNSDNISEGINFTTASTIQNISESNTYQTTTPTVSNVMVAGNVRQPGCTTRPDPGECRGAFPRFYYNAALDQCDCFLFGGCDEEGVQFTWLTLRECVNACVPTNVNRGPGCQRATLDEVQTFLDSQRKPADISDNEIKRN